MSSTLILIVVVVGSYLAAHIAFAWLAERFNIVSGAEYLLLGLLLGPQVLGVLSPGAMGGFAPFLTLALGWIGVVVGAQFHLPELIRIPRAHFRIAFTEALLTLAAVSAVMVPVLAWLSGVPAGEVLIPAVALGCIATASAPTGIALVARRLGAQGAMVRQLQLTTAIDSVVSITAFGLLLAIAHGASPSQVRAPTATEWAVISIGIGVVGGALFHLFLGDERQVDRLFIGLAGAIILASGAAAYLRLSPLLPSMLIGAMLVNTSDSRQEIRKVLSVVERPIYFVLLIFAGAAWKMPEAGWGALVGLFLLLRVAAKLAGALLGAGLNRAVRSLGAGWGRGLLGQGGLAVAIGLNYLLHEGAPFAEEVFAAALVSVLLTDLLSARVAERVVHAARRAAAARLTRGLS